jgi:hypothetical protein
LIVGGDGNVDQQWLQNMQLFPLRCLLLVSVSFSRVAVKPCMSTVGVDGCELEEGVQAVEAGGTVGFL